MNRNKKNEDIHGNFYTVCEDILHHLGLKTGDIAVEAGTFVQSYLLIHRARSPSCPSALMVDARHNHRLFLHLPCGVTRHLKTVINRFEMAHPLGKAKGFCRRIPMRSGL